MATNNDVNVKITVDASQAQQSTENYKAKLKELKEQMAQLMIETNGLADATEEQKKAFAELEKQAGQITDALGDVSQRVKANADDYQNFNAVLQGLGAATAVVQGLTGQLEMLGVTNVGTEKLVKTFMALQSQLNAINQLQKVFNKDSQLMIALQSQLNTAIQKGGASMQFATKAQKALNAAMKAAPYIAIAAAIISIVSALASFVRGTDDAANAQDNLQKNTAAANAELERQKYLMQQNTQDTKTAMETLIQMAKEAGGNQAKLTAIFEQFSSQTGFTVRSITDMNSALVLYNNKISKNTELGEKLNAQNDALRESTADLTAKYARLKNDLSQLTEGSESYNLALSEMNNTTSQINANNNKLAENTKQMTRAQAENKEILAEFNVESRKRAGLDKEIVSNSHTRAKVTKEQIELLKVLDMTEGTNYANTIKYQDQITASLAKQMAERQQILDSNKEYSKMVQQLMKETNDLDNETLSGNEKIIAKYAERVEEVKKMGFTEEQTAHLISMLYKQRGIEMTRYWKERNEQDEKEAKETIKRAIQTNVEIHKAQLSNLEVGTEEYFTKKKELETAYYEADQADLLERLDNELITQTEYDLLFEELEKQHQQNLTDIQKEEDSKRLEMTQNRLQTVGSMFANMSDFVTGLMELELEEAEGNEKKQKEIKKKYATAQAVMKIGQIGIDTALGIMGVWSQVMQLGPIAGPILGAVLSATIGALGVVNTAKAIQEKNKIMKASRGAYVVGPSHTAGGVGYELEGGEMVLNKNVAKVPQFRAIASAMNVATGGVALGGGGVASQQSFGVTKEDVQSIVAETVAGIAAIPVVVSAQTITETQRRVNVTQTRSQI